MHADRIDLGTGHRSVVEATNRTGVAGIVVRVVLKATTGRPGCGCARDLGQFEVPVAGETESSRGLNGDCNRSIAIEIHVDVLSRIYAAYSGHAARSTRHGHIVGDTHSLTVWRRQTKVQEIDPQLAHIRVLAAHVDATPGEKRGRPIN